jgi:hypothetical protein
MPEEYFSGRDLPVRRPEKKPVITFQGKTLEVDRYSDLGGGVYWFVAEELPAYGGEEEKGGQHG